MQRTLPGAGGSHDRLAERVTLACLLEVAADKPGNITPAHDYADTTWLDMARSALALGRAFESDRVRARSVGELIGDGVDATAAVSAGNPNLGIVLLFAPLVRAAASAGNADEPALRAALVRVLEGLGVADARDAFAAIVRAAPGGLGDASDHDVRAPAAIGLREAMAAAAARDRVAAEYAHGYPVVFDHGLPLLRGAVDRGQSTLEAVATVHLELLGRFPDTLIARKAGVATAVRVSAEARDVLTGRRSAGDLDAALRVDGHRLNPGTTADLVAATLLAALLTGVALR